jgi:hypothetical protein
LQSLDAFDPFQDATSGKIDILDLLKVQIAHSVQYIDVLLREFLDVNTPQALEVSLFLALIPLHMLPHLSPSFLIVDRFLGQEKMGHLTNPDQIHRWRWHTHHLIDVVRLQLVQACLDLDLIAQ